MSWPDTEYSILERRVSRGFNFHETHKYNIKIDPSLSLQHVKVNWLHFERSSGLRPALLQRDDHQECPKSDHHAPRSKIQSSFSMWTTLPSLATYRRSIGGYLQWLLRIGIMIKLSWFVDASGSRPSAIRSLMRDSITCTLTTGHLRSELPCVW